RAVWPVAPHRRSWRSYLDGVSGWSFWLCLESSKCLLLFFGRGRLYWRGECISRVCHGCGALGRIVGSNGDGEKTMVPRLLMSSYSSPRQRRGHGHDQGYCETVWRLRRDATPSFGGVDMESAGHPSRHLLAPFPLFPFPFSQL